MEIKKIEPKRKKLDKVVTGEVSTQKRSGWSLIKDDFLKSDMSSIKTYILSDVLIPNIKDMIANGFKSAIDMMLYGEARHYGSNGIKKGVNGAIQKISYSDYYSNSYGNGKKSNDISSTKEIYSDDLVFENREDAEHVLRLMMEITKEYDRGASLLDLYELVGRPTTPSQDNYGWRTMNGADIFSVPGGYKLSMPPIKVL